MLSKMSLTIKNYDKFVEKFSEAVRNSGGNICFYGYGSYINGDFVPGRSDLDGGLVLDSNFITPKAVVRNLAVGLENVLKETNLGNENSSKIKVQFNLMDRGINRDGRFLAYDDTYTDHLKNKARVFTGPNFLKEMTGMNYKREVLRSAAYNLRKARNGLLMHFVNLREDPLIARKNAVSCMNVLWSMQKKLIELATEEIVFRENETLNLFEKTFPEYDARYLKLALCLRTIPSYFFETFGNLENAFDLSKKFVSATELMIQTYIKKYPEVSSFEVIKIE